MKRLILGLILAAGAVGSAFAGEVQLAKDGKACAEIVVAETADRAALFAAQDLKYHLDRMTGGDFRIVTDAAADAASYRICVGESKLTRAKKADFGPQQFLVEVRADATELVGFDKDDKPDAKKMPRVAYDPEKGMVCAGFPDMYDEQGTMYAVYEFLGAKLGVRWVDDTDGGERIPKRPDLSADCCRERREPFMFYRGGTFNLRSYNAFLWRDGTAEMSEIARLAWKNGGDRAARRTLFLLRHRAGGRNGGANHSFYHFYNLYWDEKDDNFIEKKPEIWAKTDGAPDAKPPQLCYSNPETVRLVVQTIRDYFDKGGYPQWKGKGVSNMGRAGGYVWGRDGFCLESMDNDTFCQCPKCQSEYETDRPKNSARSTHWFKFVNAVAREIKKSHPGKQIRTLAYAGHQGVPTGLTLEDNVVVYVCITANRTCYSSLLDTELGLLKSWHDAYPSNRLALWLYNCFPREIAENGNFRCFPGFFAHEGERQYRLFRDCNARGGAVHCGFIGEVENYMHLEWMFDPDRKADDMLEEYFASYGPAKKPLRDFYEIVERRYCDRSLYPPGAVHQNVKLAWGVLGTEDVMRRLGECMAAAEKAVAARGTETDRRRVGIWKRAVWDYMKEGADAYRERTKLPCPSFVARRVADAGGNPDAVRWQDIAAEPRKLFEKGCGEETPYGLEVRFAHDGKHLYLEYAQGFETKKLVSAAKIFPVDETEIMVARSEAQPYRCWFVAPDGRFDARSYGEVNWRQDVESKESGHPGFDATCRSDISAPDRWVIRLAIPFGQLAAERVNPGDTIYVNATSVMQGRFKVRPGGQWCGIFTLTPGTTVHTTDRMARVSLEK